MNPVFKGGGATTAISWLMLTVTSFLLLSITTSRLEAQTGSLAGHVRSAETGDPLAAVQITLSAEEEAVAGFGGLTRANGAYLLLNIPAGTYLLRAELLGYGVQTRQVEILEGQTTVFDFLLDPEAISLSEIVVTGVAAATQRTKLPFDVTQIQAGELKVPLVTAAQSLQGKVAGAQVGQGSGRPGYPTSILLRGVTSLDANGRSQDPLYIVDGVILGADLVDIDALDIQSIEVVKGAAGASLYGARAANGVVHIRTKRGAELPEDRIRYALQTEYGKNDLPRIPEVFRVRSHGYALTPDGQQFLDADGQPCDWLECTSLSLAGQGAGGGIADRWNTYQANPYPGKTYNQADRFFTQGDFLQANLTVDGRSGGTNFRITGSRLGQDGIFRYFPGLERSSVRVNLDQVLSEALSLKTSTFFSRSSMPLDGEADPLSTLVRLPPNVDLLAEDPENPGEFVFLVDPERGFTNPLYELDHSSRTRHRGRFLGGVTVTYASSDWLDLEGNFSYDRTDEEREVLREREVLTSSGSDQQGGYLGRSQTATEAINASLTASARWNPGDRIQNTTRLRYLVEAQDYERWSTSGFDFAVSGIHTLSNLDPSTISAASVSQPIRGDGYFLITNFDIHDRYILDGLIRNDGSSLFGKDEQRQWYCRIGGAWRLAEESFFDVPQVDEFKLRYSLGTAGGRPSFEAQYETFTVSGGRVSPVNLGNRNLKPEFSTEHEAGIDLSLFDYKAVLSLTYARTTTDDQILQVPLPAFGGYQTQWQNAGTIESRSWEASLDLRLVERPGFDWRATILLDATRAKITKLAVPPFKYGVLGYDLFYALEGEKIGTWYGARPAETCGDLPGEVSCDGFAVNDDGFLVWTGDGGFQEARWGDDGPTVGESTVKWGTPFNGYCTDKITGEETQFCPLGNSIPDYNLGISTLLTWHGLSLYTLFSRSVGFDVYNNGGTAGGLDSDQSRIPEADRKPIGYYGGYGTGNIAYGVEDGTFTKLRELAISYRVPSSMLGRVPGLAGAESASLSLLGRNVFTWSDYRGYDPEAGSAGGDTGSSLLARYDRYTYPQFRTWTLALEVVF